MAAFLGRAEASLKGAKELDAQLKALGAGLAPKVIRGSLSDALKPTLALWRAGMAEGTRTHRTHKGRLVAPGFSRRNSYISSGVSRDGTKASATVGAKDEAFYNLWFLETVGFTGGKGKRKGRKGKTRTGRKVAPKPVLVPAFKATRSTMLSTLTASIRKRLDKIARKKAATK